MKRLTVVLIAIAFAASAIGHVRGDMPSTQSGQWTPAGVLSGMRAGAASVLLPSGAVLVTGGSAADGATATVDLFGDGGVFSPVVAMTTARTDHAAVVLADGRALVIGGRNADGAVASVEAYADGAWTTVGSLADARWSLTATLLSDGRVLVAGGENATGPVATVETFDPATGQWTVAGTMTSPRTGHAAARLADGRVLLAGGFSGDAVLTSIDVFDPANGTITAGPALSVARAGLSATALLDGKVLFIGGNDGSNDLASAELFNPATGVVSMAASSSLPRRDHQAFLLPANNTVLIAGGVSGAETASAEVYVPWANEFRATGSMGEPRSNATGVALAREGVLLIAGGESRASSELYGFATLATDKDDYAPGESVTMFGRGWQPGETVTLALREVPQEHASRFFNAVADDTGRIINTDFVVEPHHLGVRFYLTASGAASQAQITFTDAFSVQTVTVGAQSPNPVIAGSAATYNVSVSFNGNNQTPCTAVLSVAGLPANATGSFSSTSVTSASGTSTLTVNTTGVTPNPSPNPIYNFTVTATMNPVGDGCRDTNANGNGTLRVNAATGTTTGLSSSQDPSVYGDPVTFTATVTPAAGTTAPTGNIQFKVDGVNFGGTVPLSPSGSTGVATSGAISTLTAMAHSITAVYTPSGSFSGSTGTFTQHVSKRPASVTPAAASKEYGAADPAFTGALSGFVASDNVIATYSRTSGETVAGSPYTISATLSPAGVLGNYTITSNTANFAITARALTVTADAKTKIYGNADPALTYQLTSGTLVSGDTLTGSPTRTAGEQVGNYAILQGTLTAGPNYTINYVGANLTITPRSVTVTADGKSKVYGDADPALTYQITSGSLAFSDAFSGGLTRTAGEDVGSHAIQQGTLALSANYDLHFVGANLTITPRSVTVTADAKSKVYGDADPALTYQITSGSLAFTDTFSGGLTRTAGEDVGSHAILQGTLALSANYELHFVGANLAITPRSVTVTADGKSKVYGDADPALTYQITSGSLAFSDAFSGGLTRTAGEDVGSHAIQQGTLALSANYDLHFVGANLTITPRSVTVTADAKSKVYGDADPALTYQLTSGSLAFTDTFSGGLTRTAGEDVGSHAIQQGTLALSANYELHFVGANLTITPRSVTVTADGKSKVYGDGDPALTYQITDGSLAFSDAFSGALTRTAGEDVGSHAIQQGTLALSANYDLHFVGANLTITPRSVTVTADGKSKVYGDADPALTYQITDGSLAFSDAFSGALTRTVGEDVGSHAIQQGTLALSANYELHFVGANLTITPRSVTVTADGKSKVYGDADPALTYQITSGSLAFSDAFSGALTRTAGEDVGSHAIQQGTLALSANYDLHFVGANLTITPRSVTVTADGKSKVYGDADPALTYQITDGSLAFSDAFSGALTRTAGEDVGSHAIQQGTLALSANYDLHFVGANLTITPRSVTVTADGKSKVYGDADPALTYQITDGSLAFSDAFSGALTRTVGEDVGSHAIQQGTLALSANYELHFVGANLTITPRSVTVTADGKSKVYGDADPALTYQITSGSLAFSDAFSGALTRTAGEDVGSHAIQQGTLALSANYDLHFVGANLAITKRAVIGQITVDNKVYDGGTSATILTRTLDNVVPEDDVQLTGGSATFADKNAGSGKLVTGSGFSLSGDDAGNYTLGGSPISTTASINRRTLHVGAGGHNKVYDGNTIAVVTLTDDRIGGDALTIGYGSALFADKHVGMNKSVSVTGITVGGADAANYNANPATTATADITRRTLTVTALAQNKTYDGNALATVTLSDDRVTGDTLVTAYASASFNDKNVGNGKPVNVTDITVTGPDAGNYAANTSAVTAANIIARALTVTADAKSKIFGNPDPPLTYQLTGSLVTGDVFTGALTRVSGELVGSYPIQQGTLTAGGNYAIAFVPATLTIASWNVTGFYNPVTMSPTSTPVYNTIKGGSTVPLKFNIYAGTVERTSVTDVVGFTLQPILCGSLEDPVDEFTTTGGTTLRYDTTGHQFIQNWQTPKGANACYKVTMTAQDGSKIWAYFKTK